MSGTVVIRIDPRLRGIHTLITLALSGVAALCWWVGAWFFALVIALPPVFTAISLVCEAVSPATLDPEARTYRRNFRSWSYDAFSALVLRGKGERVSIAPSATRAAGGGGEAGPPGVTGGSKGRVRTVYHVEFETVGPPTERVVVFANEKLEPAREAFRLAAAAFDGPVVDRTAG